MGRKVERAEVEKWLAACADILRRQPDIVEACRQLGVDPEALRLEVAAVVPPVDGFVEGGLFRSALDGVTARRLADYVASSDEMARVNFQYSEEAPPVCEPDLSPIIANVVSFETANDPLRINVDPMLSSRTGFAAPGPQDEE